MRFVTHVWEYTKIKYNTLRSLPCLSVTGAFLLHLVDPCAPKWVRFDHGHSVNGQHYKALNSTGDCLGFCVGNNRCVSVDYEEPVESVTGGCWVHSNETDLYNFTYAMSNNVSQYVIDRRCLAGTFLIIIFVFQISGCQTAP